LTPLEIASYNVYRDRYLEWWNARTEWKKVERRGSTKLRVEKHEILGSAYDEMKRAKIALDQMIVRQNK
jgi:hypothetical protein